MTQASMAIDVKTARVGPATMHGVAHGDDLARVDDSRPVEVNLSANATHWSYSCRLRGCSN
jgi:hypothetical protein